MDGIKNAQHDIADAAFSIETAIDVLSSIKRDGAENDELSEVISKLLRLRGGLEDTYQKLEAVDVAEPHP